MNHCNRMRLPKKMKPVEPVLHPYCRVSARLNAVVWGMDIPLYRVGATLDLPSVLSSLGKDKVPC